MTAAAIARQAIRDGAELWDLVHDLDGPGIAALEERLTKRAAFAIALIYAAGPEPPTDGHLQWLDDLADADPTSPQPHWEDTPAC